LLSAPSSIDHLATPEHISYFGYIPSGHAC
jgi:hypothetical protein